MQPVAPPFDVTPEELEALLEGVRDALGEAGYQKLKAAIRTLGYLAELLRERDITLDGLRELLLSPAGASTEKTRQVLQNAGIETQKQNQEKQNSQASQRSRPGTAAMGSTPIAGRRRSKSRIPACTRETAARSAARGRSMFWSRRECWCGWWDRRPLQVRSTNWRNCAAIFVCRCSRQKPQPGWARRSTMLPRPA